MVILIELQFCCMQTLSCESEAVAANFVHTAAEAKLAIDQTFHDQP